ncbi:glycosyltransferase family 2 protein [Cobetia marina]|uniref:glycosyltransferase family 2 protein n=1 Tax=Cobetia marina TaxID=28258 RepID=UPI0010ADFC63|nr:glycosyltransferase family 2 protein [Cobetia marina]TKD62626.1 glycosyltransferase family 2 protein [Cobetia marina]
MLISIVIPHKNSPQKLKRLLNTIPNDSDIEIIVVDDNSDTDLKAKTIEVHHENIKLLDNDSDYNAGTARNLALNHVNGKWVIFADADDAFIQENFCLLKMELINSDDIDLVFFKCISLFENNGNKSPRADFYNDLLDANTIQERILAYNWVVPWGKAIKRSLIEKYNIKFDSRIASNDVMFSTKIAYHSKNITKSNLLAYCCYQSDNSLTASLDETKAYHRLGALVDRNIFLIKHNIRIKKDLGITYFKYSLKYNTSMSKIKLYLIWMLLLPLVVLYNIRTNN